MGSGCRQLVPGVYAVGMNPPLGVRDVRCVLILRPCCLAFLGALLCASGGFAQGTGGIGTPAQLKKLSLEELMNVEVTSVSRKEERAAEAAAAVHVITEEDVRRSGARSIPEALRLAPNLQVAQVSSDRWAISARGFNAAFSNKLLVLIDGRTVYSPLFSGVFWDVQDTLLEDLDRVEVISGPGATVWGANAVNGVINIITKSAKDTQGILATAGAGNEEQFLGGFRYGGRAGDNLYYRLYGKYFARDDAVFPNGDDAGDGWHSGQGGFRLEWESDHRNLLTFQGDVYDGRVNQLDDSDISQSGSNLLARWTRRVTDTEQFHIQTYYDRTHQLVPGQFGDDLDTFDVDATYERDITHRQHVMIGAGYRFTHDNVQNFPGAAFLPASLNRNLFSVFVQDEISLVHDRVRLTIGSKFERNDYTGFEVQPSGRIAWTNDPHVLWGAVSRAVRTPSRIDRHLFAPENPPFIFAGGPNFVSEKVIAYELGWRVKPHKDVFVSVATFFNDYDDIRSISPEPPFFIENNVEGEVGGLELEAAWQATAAWRFTAGYTLLQEDLRVKRGQADLSFGQGEAFDPEHQFQVRSSLTLPREIEFDAWVRYVDQVGNTSARGFGVLPAYGTLDMRVGWSPIKHLQIAIVGQNLLEDQHAEFGFLEIERSLYAKATWRF
jgi:iron complex outermembrane receptor protein